MRAPWTALAALAAALLFTVAQTGSADAQTGSVRAAMYSLLDNFQTNTCLVQHGYAAPAYLDNCGPNHSFYWTFSW
jgi:hypothetical protein